MASAQRENARKEKQLKKERKIRITIWVILLVVVFGLAAMRVAEIDFTGIKNKLSGGVLTSAIEADVYPYSLDSASGVKLDFINDKLIAQTDTSCRVLNPADAKELYSFSSGYANPIMTMSGKYLFTIDQGGTRLRLDSTKDNIYESTIENTVLCGDVSANGCVVYATRSSSNKTEVVVSNISLKKLAKIRVKDGYVVAVAIDSTGKKFTYATVNSKSAKLVTTLHTCYVGDDEPKAKLDYVDSNLLDISYAKSGDLYYVAAESLHVIKNQKKDVEVFANGKAYTVTYNYTPDGRLVYVYSKYADASENYVAYVSSNGKVKTSIKLKQKPKFVSCNSEICVLFSDKVVTYSVNKGEKKATYKCDDSVQSANKLSSKVFITRHQLIDVLED